MVPWKMVNRWGLSMSWNLLPPHSLYRPAILWYTARPPFTWKATVPPWMPWPNVYGTYPSQTLQALSIKNNSTMEYIRLYKTSTGIFAYYQDRYYQMDQDWDTLVNSPALFNSLRTTIASLKPADNAEAAIQTGLLPPIGTQEIWAAGVTYFRSKVARMEESEVAGGATFYDMGYLAAE